MINILNAVVFIEGDDINPVVDLKHQAMVAHRQPAPQIEG
jgi:hypothetical protein